MKSITTIAEYRENGMGYLIQKTDTGYRYLFVEAGEDTLVGKSVSTRRAAIQQAVNDWRETGQGDDWATWSRQMVADANAPDRVNATDLADLISEQVGDTLTEAQIRDLSLVLAGFIQ